MSMVNHSNIRNELKEHAIQNNIEWRTGGSVYPIPALQNRYSAIFMSAHREEDLWIYQGNPNEQRDQGLIAGTSWCVRSDKGFGRAGQTNRHMTSFEMFSISGRTTEEYALESAYTMLALASNAEPTQFSATVHPDDNTAKTFFYDRNIRFEIGDTFFSRSDTDRSGHRVEFKISFDSQGKTQTWEVFNLVLLTQANIVGALSPYIIDGGGSFERLMAIREGVDDVFKTTMLAPHVDRVREMIKDDETARQSEGIIDLARTGVVMAQSGYEVGTKNRQQQTFRKLGRELSQRGIKQGLPPTFLLDVMANVYEDINSWADYIDKFPNVINPLEQSGIQTQIYGIYNKYDVLRAFIAQEVSKGNEVNKTASKAANRFDGGTYELVNLALRSLGY
jgi:alanyl-tRNA synthetase